MGVFAAILCLGALLTVVALAVLLHLAAGLDILPQSRRSELPTEPGEPLSLQALARITHRSSGAC
jgi:hypothetical protein